MATGASSGPVHPEPTRRSGYRYFFYDKHHGKDAGAARWRPELSRDQEFAVFNTADEHEVYDTRGWYYGVGRDSEGEILELGTWGQQVAEFPYARPGELWHGYPHSPLNEVAPPNRQKQQCRPHKDVFRRMESCGILDSRERGRLEKGNFV
jgi:hypothetical protein